MTFANPQMAWMLLVLPILALVPALGNRQMLSRRARWAATGLRAVALVLLAAALMEPVMPSRRERAEETRSASTVCAIDVSSSVRPAEIEKALHDVKRLLDAKAGPEVLLFGKEVYRATPSDLESLASLKPLEWLGIVGWKDREAAARGTHLERALRAAADGSARSLVLFSDGNETGGSAEKALPVLVSRGIRVTAVPMKPLEPDSLALENLVLPAAVLDGREFEGQATIRSSGPGEVRLEIRRGEHVVRQENVRVQPGVTVVPFKEKLTTPGFHGYTATVAPLGSLANGRPEDDRASGIVQVLRVPKVMIVSNAPGRLGKLLDAAKLEHKAIAPAKMPSDPSAYSEFSSVIVDDVDASELPESKQKAVATWVREQGGGLLAIGGEHGFGAGGWSGSELEKILPVNSNPKGYDKGLGLIILLDSSGSMAGFPMEAARKACREIIGLMRGRWLGIINFSHIPEVAVSFQVIGTDSYVVRKDIDQIMEGGGTLFYQPLRHALDILSKVELDQKHVLMLSDGEAADFFMVRSLYDRFNAADIKVSTMAVGRFVNQDALQEIADSTGGHFYGGEDFAQLPEMFRQEVKRISGPPIVQQPFKPVVTQSKHPLASALPLAELPQLHGYDATSPKPRAEVLLASPRGDPILATWHAGVGKTAAFTSDFSPAWGRDWVTWSDAPRFFGALMGELGRIDVSDYHVSASAVGGQGRVVVDAIDASGQYLNFQKLIGRVAGPSGAASTIAFRQVAPGRYEASFPLEEEGVHRVKVFRQESGSEKAVGDAALALSTLPEFRASEPNHELLAHLASATGGQVAAQLDGAPQAPAPAGAVDLPGASTALWPLFASLGLALFLAEVICRRLGKFSATEGSSEAPEAEGAHAFVKIAEKYVRAAKEMDASGDHAKASEAYLKARSYFLKAQKTDMAQMMWDRYRLLEDKRQKK